MLTIVVFFLPSDLSDFLLNKCSSNKENINQIKIEDDSINTIPTSLLKSFALSKLKSPYPTEVTVTITK